MKVLITGCSGQDGSILAELLIKAGHEVYGMIRRSSTPNYWRLEHIRDQIRLVMGDMCDYSSLCHIVRAVQPELVFNCAAMSFVGASWSQPEVTTDITGTGVLRLLEAVRQYAPQDCRFLQFSSSEMWGKVLEIPQTEKTPFNPQSPYAVAKTYAHYINICYRRSYNMHASSIICLNHESDKRGDEFVTQKIAKGAARIRLSLEANIEPEPLRLGNLKAKRDWSHARDICRGAILAILYPEPRDWVLASGQTRSVEEFCHYAFSAADIPDWRKYVVVDEGLFRPAEVDVLLGDATKAMRELGWKPEISFEELVEEMVQSALDFYRGNE